MTAQHNWKIRSASRGIRIYDEGPWGDYTITHNKRHPRARGWVAFHNGSTIERRRLVGSFPSFAAARWAVIRDSLVPHEPRGPGRGARTTPARKASAWKVRSCTDGVRTYHYPESRYTISRLGTNVPRPLRWVAAEEETSTEEHRLVGSFPTFTKARAAVVRDELARRIY